MNEKSLIWVSRVYPQRVERSGWLSPLFRNLPKRQELTVYCNSRYTPADTSIPGVKLIRIPTLPGKYLQPVSLFMLSALHALFKGDYDLIHLTQR